jgi:peptide/nickel transport system substrate-binding protein
MSRNKSLLIFSVILLAAIVLAACVTATPTAVAPTNTAPPSVAATATSAPKPTAQPVAGKSYKMGIFEDLTTTNFWQANGPDNTVWNAYALLPMRLGLYTLSDQHLQLIPSLAADFASPIATEGDKWSQTVALKKGITWSDGQPVTAKDAAFTINTVLKFGLVSGNWQAWVDYNYVDSAVAVDDNTLKVIYHTKPGIARTDWGVFQVPILCDHFWTPKIADAAKPLEGLVRPAEGAPQADVDAYNAKLADAQKALFSIDPNGEPLAGSFVFSKWEKGAYFQSNANPNFYQTGAEVVEFANGAYHESKVNVYDFKGYGDLTGDKTLDYTVGPFVSSAQYILYSDQNAALLALKKGEVDFVLNPLGLQKGLADQVKDDPNLNIIQNPSLGFRYLSFNIRHKPMDSVAFRQAFATLIDKEFVTNTILQGVAYPLQGFVPKSNAAWYYPDVPLWGYNTDGTPMTREQRVNTAIDILTKGGFKWQGDKKPSWDAKNKEVIPGGALLMPDGKPVPALQLLAPTYSYDPMRSTMAIWIETWCKEMGIPVTAKLTGFNTIIDTVFSKQDFDIYILGYSVGIFPSYLRDFWHSDQAVLDGNNAGGYIDKDFDTLADQLLTCDSYEACHVIGNQIQKKVANDVPWIALFDTGIYEAYSKNATFPYTSTIGGLQQSVYGMPWAVKLK